MKKLGQDPGPFWCQADLAQWPGRAWDPGLSLHVFYSCHLLTVTQD